MPLNAVGWTTEEDEKLIELVKPHSHLYQLFGLSRKNILARVSTWQEISNELMKPVEECKKRWRGLRDGYMRSKRMGALHKTKVPIFEKLQFLDSTGIEDPLDNNLIEATLEFKNTEEVLQGITMVDGQLSEDHIDTEQQVITDNQEYYEITLVDGPQQDDIKPFIKIMPKVTPEIIAKEQDLPKKVVRKNAGRKRSLPMQRNVAPVKILPKPIIVSEPRIVRCVEEPKTTEQRSQVIDKLIEKVLKENTNEIDVFFRSMAASVKKLQPNLIPKVKMEVCNVIAKYEMQSFDKTVQNL